MSSTISRVMSTYKCVIIIYLVASSPIHSSVLPKSTTGNRIAFVLILLRTGFALTITVTSNAVVSYTATCPILSPVIIPKQPSSFAKCSAIRIMYLLIMIVSSSCGH